MNLRIEKVDVHDTETLSFLVEENEKMIFELNSKYLLTYGTEYQSYFKRQLRESFLKEINEGSIIYSAYLNDEIVGCIFLEENGYLNSLFVRESYRNQLIGSKLLEKLIADCNNFQIIRVDARITAISLYERFSFHRIDGKSNEAFIPMALERKTHEK